MKTPLSWLRNPIRRYRDQLRFVYGRKSSTNYFRLFPNFGFLITFKSLEVRYSLKRGFSFKRT
jgi:hypothetical protein